MCLTRNVSALGGHLEVSVVGAGRRTRLLGESASAGSRSSNGESAKPGSFNALNHRSRKRADSAEPAEKPMGKTLLRGTKRRKPTDILTLPRGGSRVRIPSSAPSVTAAQAPYPGWLFCLRRGSRAVCPFNTCSLTGGNGLLQTGEKVMLYRRKFGWVGGRETSPCAL